MAARLNDATSPYLRQHVGNPVDWWPWGSEARAEAARLDRPLLISIGYSSCHWCHVMAHESFEDPAIAEVMNAAYVNVKVDREERPDVDAVYMAALQAMTGRGGWPLTVFAAPDGRPFYAGTYFPPTSRHGLNAWRDVLEAVAHAWRTRRGDIESHASALVAAIQDDARVRVETGTGPALDERLLVAATRQLLADVDPVAGGFGGPPKFPHVGALSFLLRRHVRTADAQPLSAVVAAVDAMLSGGLHDQLAGGFHRYCVDAGWTVPHFEKMLYDNAQLLTLLTELWQVTGEPRFAVGARSTAAFLLGELRGPDGAFYGAIDADTAAGEGAFHTWAPSEVTERLSPADADLALRWFGVTPSGNTDDARTVLTARADPVRIASASGWTDEELRARLEDIGSTLLAARRERPAPATDTKIIVGWNALAIDAFARAGQALGEPTWIDAAASAASFILAHVRSDAPPHRLAHHAAAGTVGVAAFCDDVASMANACISLYEATFDPRWRAAASDLASTLVADFADPVAGSFSRTAAYHEALAARDHDVVDTATPSGNGAAALALLRVAALVDDTALEQRAGRALEAVAASVAASPLAFGDTLVAVDAYVFGMRTVTFDRPPSGHEPLLDVVRRRLNVATVLRCRMDEAARAPAPSAAVAEVCMRGRCLLPVDAPARLLADLAATDAGDVGP